MTQDIFTTAFNIVVGEEGGYSDDPHDPGNWTGNMVGLGTLRGTKWGISAGSFPTLDIKSLTIDQAMLIYHGKYWSPIHGDALPPALAVTVFDAAVNNGLTRAVVWLQKSVGASPDGIVGPKTLEAVQLKAKTTADAYAVCADIMDQRMWFMSGLDDWHINRGWCTRLATLPWTIVQLGDAG